MSGTITPPDAISPGSVTRQTLVYGDRPLGVIRDGQVYATNDFYQFLSRLSSGFGTTVENVGTVVTATNQLSTNVTDITDELVTINEEIQNNTTQILNIQGDPGFPPTPQAPQPPVFISQINPTPIYPDAAPPFPLARAVGLGFFFAGSGF